MYTGPVATRSIGFLMILSQKQDLRPVQTVEIPSNRNQALATIDLHIQRSEKPVTLVQVGRALFEAAFPDRNYPHKVGSIGEVCVFPRPDLLGDWQLRVIPVPESSCAAKVEVSR